MQMYGDEKIQGLKGMILFIETLNVSDFRPLSRYVN